MKNFASKTTALPFILSLLGKTKVTNKDAEMITNIFYSMPAANRIDEDAVGRHMELIQLMLCSFIRAETGNTVRKSEALQLMLNDILNTVAGFSNITNSTKPKGVVH